MSYIVKKSITLSGHRTSLSLEAPFWSALSEIAQHKGITLPKLIQDCEAEMIQQKQTNLSSFMRVFVLDYYRS